MRIAVIPARGGSKRIPRKNVRMFSGKPMISFAINAALQSQLFDHVVVSTDDDEIAAVARAHGAEVPFMRPQHLADDLTATLPVVVDVIEKCQDLGWKFDIVCCIYPCVPLIQKQDLCNSLTRLNNSEADFCFPVCEYPSPIQRALKMDVSGRTSGFYPEFELSRSQDLERAYFDAGQFYWGSVHSWLTTDRVHSNSVGFPIPFWRTVDIDTVDDWVRAENLYQTLSINH
jgi:N-acylneuraminate cytidylyltransferase